MEIGNLECLLIVTGNCAFKRSNCQKGHKEDVLDVSMQVSTTPQCWHTQVLSVQWLTTKCPFGLDTAREPNTVPNVIMINLVEMGNGQSRLLARAPTGARAVPPDCVSHSPLVDLVGL
jgi:hypothetical protein